MSVLIPRGELITSLDRVRHCIAGSRMVELYQCFCFQDNKVSAYSGQSGAITKCQLEGDSSRTPPAFAIRADTFYRLCKSLFENVELDLQGGTLRIVSGGNQTTLNVMPAKAFPEIIPPEYSTCCEAADFVEALDQVKFTVGTNAMQPKLLGVCVSDSHVYSADGNRATRAILASPFNGTVSIPSSAVDQLVRLGKPDCVFMSGSRSILGTLYRDTKTVYVTQLLADGFPYKAIDEAFGEWKTVSTVEFPDGFIDAVERVQMLSPPEDPDVIVAGEPNQLIVSTSSSGVGAARESVPWEGNQLTFRFAVRPAFLVSSLQKSRSVDLADVVSGNNSKLLFHRDGFDHMLALMVLRGT